MKRYRSHKVVEAAPVVSIRDERDAAGIETGNVIVRLAHNGGEYDMTVTADTFARGKPNAGDYLVRYEPDGYVSWSPRNKFEAGYTETE